MTIYPTTEAEYRAILERVNPDELGPGAALDWTPPLDYEPCVCGHGLFLHWAPRMRSDGTRSRGKAPCGNGVRCDCEGWRAASEQEGFGW